jgi:uncharacterized membrane protein YfbV (UPF0208 family)
MKRVKTGAILMRMVLAQDVNDELHAARLVKRGHRRDTRGPAKRAGNAHQAADGYAGKLGWRSILEGGGYSRPGSIKGGGSLGAIPPEIDMAILRKGKPVKRDRPAARPEGSRDTGFAGSMSEIYIGSATHPLNVVGVRSGKTARANRLKTRLPPGRDARYGGVLGNVRSPYRSSATLKSFSPIAYIEVQDPLASETLRWRLEKAATTGEDFQSENVEEFRSWVTTHQSEALDLIHQPAVHGRVCCLILEFLAEEPTNSLRQTFLNLLDASDDLWLLAGVVSQVRRIGLPGQEAALRDKLRTRLEFVLRGDAAYKDRLGNSWQSLVGQTALGEVLMAFGSVALASDIPLLGVFVLGDRERKPRNNAFDALARTVRRHTDRPETDAFFAAYGAKLEQFAAVWAESQRSARELGVLLLCWMELVVARLGPEADSAVALAEKFPSETRSVRVRLKEAHQALEKMGRQAWLTERADAYGGWLARLEHLVPTPRAVAQDA